jgi:transcriptional regulator with XRE-family HTH domain
MNKGLAAIHVADPSPQMRLRIARERLGLTQRELAEGMGLTVQAISDVERGINSLSMHVLTALVCRHRVSAYWLLEGKGPVMRDE